MFGNTSMFGFQSTDPASRAAYDMMVLDQIEKDDKEIALRKMYRPTPNPSFGYPTEEEEEEDDWLL